MNPTTDTPQMQEPQDEQLSGEQQLLVAVLEQLQNKLSDLETRVAALEGNSGSPQSNSNDVRFDALNKVADALKDITGKKEPSES